MKRNLGIAGVVAVTLVILFRPWSWRRGGEEDTGRVRMVLWRVPPEGTRKPVHKASRAVYDEFCRAHPEIEVVLGQRLRIEGPAAGGSEFLAVAGGMAPDVFSLFGRKIGDYRQQGFLYPLDEFLKEYAREKGHPFRGNLAPDPIWEVCYHGGHIWAVPYAYYAMGLLYRKDLFGQANLPLRAPRDWEELYRFARAATYLPEHEPDAPPGAMSIYGYALDTTPEEAGWHFLQYVWSGGGEVARPYKRCPDCGKLNASLSPPVDYKNFHVEVGNEEEYEARLAAREKEECVDCGRSLDEIEDLQWRLVTQEEGGQRALKFFYDRMTRARWLRCPNGTYRHNWREYDLTPGMEKEGVATCPECGTRVSLRTESGRRRIYEGVVKVGVISARQVRIDYAMMIGTLSATINLGDPTRWGVGPFPSHDGKGLATFVAGHYLAINGTVEDPERRRAAWEYIRFVTGEEAQKIRVKSLVESGMGEWVRPSLLKTFGFEEMYKLLAPDWIRLNEEILRSARVEPYCRGFQHTMIKGLAVPIETMINRPGTDAREVLSSLSEKINTTVMGERSEEDLRRKERIGWVILAAVAVVIGILARKIMKLILARQQFEDTEGYGVGGARWKRELVAWCFLSIAVFNIFMWRYLPLGRGLVMAFQDYKILEGISSRYVGLKNFVDVFAGEEFWQFFLQTFYYAFLSISMGFVVPIILAVLLTEVPRGKIIFRTLYYLPAVTTGVVTLFLWKELMYGEGASGVLNQCIGWLGIGPQSWLRNARWAMAAIIVPAIWAGAGPGCLIYLAAMKGIPEAQYEAADIDGAGLVSKFWHVTVPNILALVIINFIGAVVASFKATQNIFLMTGGGPYNKTMTLGVDIWFNSYLFLNFGYATAEAWIMGSLLIGFTFTQLRILNKVQFRAAGAK